MGTQLNQAARWYYQRAVTAKVDCDGSQHRISWRRGRLVLEDHDTLAEEALVALGAKPPMCLELLDALRAWRGDLLLPELLLADRTLPRHELAHRRARHDAEMRSALAMAERMPALHRSQPQWAARARLVRRQAAERIERERRSWAATLTEALPPLLQRALALSGIVNIERHWEEHGIRGEHARPLELALTAVAGPLLELSARGWTRDLRPYQGLAAETRLLAPREQPTCALWADRRLVHATLSLPLSWFTEVWGRGIALVDDCFVLGLTETSADAMTLRVLAARPLGRDSKSLRSLERPAVVTRTGGGWRLRWI